MHHVERSRSLHDRVVLLTVQEMPTAELPAESRDSLTALGDGFYKPIVYFGYMEDPLLVPVLRAVSQAEGIPFDPDHATYNIGHETIVATNEGSLNRIPEAIFSYLNRNAVHEERRYGMPTEQIVEIGTQIEL